MHRKARKIQRSYKRRVALAHLEGDVGAFVGVEVGEYVGATVGNFVGALEGVDVGKNVGD
jgi:hypothetical protein